MSKKKFFIFGVVSVLIFVSCSTAQPENETVNDSDKLSNDESLPDSSENDDGLAKDDDSQNDDAEISENDSEEINTDDDLSDDMSDEVLSEPDEDTAEPYICADVCLAGTVSEKGVCTLWDDLNGTWIENIEDGEGKMHNRARNYVSLLRQKMMPYGGVFRTLFSDSTYETPTMHAGKRDSPIWTGTYLGSEALRYMVTKAPDALEQMGKTVKTIDDWWKISGGRGYLARYAVPVNGTPQVVLNMFDQNDPEDNLNVSFKGEMWHWKGDISRDQYQGVMFGFALAYEAVKNEEIKEIIRSNIVSTVEQLMEKKKRPVKLIVDGVPMNVQLELQYIIPKNDTEIPELVIKTNPFELYDATLLNFWPNPPEYLRQVPGLSWLPNFYLRSQAIQLASFFVIALKVTENIPEYAFRRQAILDHYNFRYQEWRDMASGWENSNKCGDSYHGLNIAFLPAFNWVRLENDYFRKTDLQNNVLNKRMWEAVKDHKNVFFSYIYTSQANPSDNIAPVVSTQTDQLLQFPPPPYLAIAVDNSAKYQEDPDCKGLSKTAIDVRERVPASFLWERNPWKLKEDAIPNFIYPGVDYLITYWMARYYGYLEDDATDTCLRWKE